MLAHDRGEVTNSLAGICPAKRSYVRWYCFAGQCLIGWVPPPMVSESMLSDRFRSGPSISQFVRSRRMPEVAYSRARKATTAPVPRGRSIPGFWTLKRSQCRSSRISLLCGPFPYVVDDCGWKGALSGCIGRWLPEATTRPPRSPTVRPASPRTPSIPSRPDRSLNPLLRAALPSLGRRPSFLA